MKKNIVLGVHCGYLHDSGAALIVDGQIKAAIAEERVSRVKKDNGFPMGAILKCLETQNLSLKDVDSFNMASEFIQYQADGASYFNGNGDLLFSGIGKSGSIVDIFKHNSAFKKNKARGNAPFADELKSYLVSAGAKEDADFNYWDHHTCHMASAFFTSGAVTGKSGFVFCVDSFGDGVGVSSYRFDDSNLPNSIQRMESKLSPGSMYSNVTRYMGLKANRHEGKITGLAAYGDANVLLQSTKKYSYYNNDISEFEVEVLSNKGIVNNVRRIQYGLAKGQSTNRMLEKMRTDFEGHTKEDVAAAAQKRLELEIANYVQDVIGDETPDCILLAGGVFANVKANAVVGELYPSSNVLVHPGMTDEGVALGAALFGDYENTKCVNIRTLADVYLGAEYGEDKVLDALSRSADKFTFVDLRDGSDSPEAQVANLVSEGKVVGLFQGRMEYGPRALGNRTILVDTKNKEVNDIVNKRLNRTEYMPFAPVVLEDRADEIFDIADNIRATCEFMTVTTMVKESWREKIPAVVHVDNTARPQLIKRDVNPVYYDIISEYSKITGIPVLVNTSFNVHEEPIVESPEDALRALEQDAIDYVFFPPFLVSLKG